MTYRSDLSASVPPDEVLSAPLVEGGDELRVAGREESLAFVNGVYGLLYVLCCDRPCYRLRCQAFCAGSFIGSRFRLTLGSSRGSLCTCTTMGRWARGCSSSTALASLERSSLESRLPVRDFFLRPPLVIRCSTSCVLPVPDATDQAGVGETWQFLDAKYISFVPDQRVACTVYGSPPSSPADPRTPARCR